MVYMNESMNKAGKVSWGLGHGKLGTTKPKSLHTIPCRQKSAFESDQISRSVVSDSLRPHESPTQNKRFKRRKRERAL